MRILIAAVVGAIALFAWGFVSWTVLDWHMPEGAELPDEQAVVKALRGANTPEGVYFVPGMKHDPSLPEEEARKIEEDWSRRHREGPTAFLVYHPGGSEPMPAIAFVRGIAIDFLAALLVACMLAAVGIRGWFGRFLFVAAFGLFGAIGEAYMWNYFGFPSGWSMTMAADHVVAWGIVGFLFASLLKPRAALPEI